MSFTNRMSLVVLAVAVIGIMVALFMEAASGPTFRPEDHADFNDCVRSIPTEWAPGSIQRSGAEDACYYVHRRESPGT